MNDVNVMMQEHKKPWKQYGCSIMSDGWTNENNRCLIKFLVNNPTTTWFLKSIDVSDTIKNGKLMFKYLDEMVEEVGEENMCKSLLIMLLINVGMRLMEKRRRLWWTPCVAHCINLMVEYIGKLSIHANTIVKAREIVKFIYGHT